VRLRLDAADLEDAVSGSQRHMSDAVVIGRRSLLTTIRLRCAVVVSRGGMMSA
jgi:hypothetical protein